MTKTPSSLLERLCVSFDQDAWARFVALYAPLIYAWGRRLGLQDQDAADLAQDVFTTLVEVLPSFAYDRHKSFRRWLRTIAVNHWKNTCKRWENRVLRGHSADVEQVAVVNDLEAAWEGEYRQHLAGQALRIMRSDFAEPTWKACWEMVVADRPAAEVGAELGLTIGAVYAAKFRVLDRLRQELRGMLD